MNPTSRLQFWSHILQPSTGPTTLCNERNLSLNLIQHRHKNNFTALLTGFLNLLHYQTQTNHPPQQKQGLNTSMPM